MAKPKSTVSTEIIPYIFYRDVPAALNWLTRAFGFAETMRTAKPNGGTHGKITLDRQGHDGTHSWLEQRFRVWHPEIRRLYRTGGNGVENSPESLVH